MRVLDLSYHPLDCRSGRWGDLSRKGNHGTPHGGARPYMIAPGVVGFKFDGVDDCMVCGSNSNLKITTEITIGMYLYPFSITNSNGGGYPTVMMRLGGDYRLFFIAGNGNFVARFSGFSDITTKIPLDKWTYAVITFNGAGFKWYIDANLDSSDTQTGSIASTATDLIIGNIDLTTARFFDGLVAQPIIEDRAWSPDEVRENMYKSPIYRTFRGLPHSMIYTKVPWKQTQGGIYVV